MRERMEKKLLTIEFRYNIETENADYEYKNKTITIGIFDTIEETISKGNESLKILSKYFKMKSDDVFKLNHIFGHPTTLVSNTCYPTKGISYFASITTLKFDDLDETINNILREKTK